MAGENTQDNPLGMSDEDFLQNMGNPPEVTETPVTPVETDTQETEEQLPVEKQEGASAEDVPSKEEEEEDTSSNNGTKEQDPDPEKDQEQGKLPAESNDGEQGKAEADPTKDAPSDKEKGASGDGSQKDKPSGAGSEKQTTTPDYEGFYKKIMTPFKANGKTIELQSPDEAIQLMQMGANYTRKMQAIQPHRKVLLMLENNNLLDEDKLSFLIDIEKKNPEAIKKLIKDAGIDPLEIDTATEPSYHSGNHRVSDEEAGFRTILDELGSNPEGKATLQEINSHWDQASKEVLWSKPEIMTVIHTQRENGIYDRIANEVERQRSIGQIPPQMPFLEAYKTVGDSLAAAGAFADLVKSSAPAPKMPATPVATRVATPKPAVKNSEKVSAASPTRSTPRTAKTVINPLAMSDDDFLNQMQNRV